MQTLRAAGLLLAIVVLDGDAAAQTMRPGGVPFRPSMPPAPGAEKGKAPQTDAFLIGAIQSQDGDVRFDVVRTHGSKGGPDTYGLKFQVMRRRPPYRFETAVLEAQELPALMAALDRMAKSAAAGDPEQTAAAVLAAYQGGTISVRLSPGGADRRLYVQIASKNPLRVALPVADLDAMTAYVRQAATKIRELERDEQKRREKSG